MPLMKRLNRVIDVPDIDVATYKTNGYELYQYQPEQHPAYEQPTAQEEQPEEPSAEDRPSRRGRPKG